MFRDAGWRQAIVSNHCPELESLVGGLGIGAFFDKVYSPPPGGNRTPVRRAVDDRATTIPEVYGSTAAAPPGRWASRRRPPPGLSLRSAVFLAVSGLSRRQPPLLLPGCGDQAPCVHRWSLVLSYA